MFKFDVNKKENVEDEVEFVLIGAGLPRTGTNSTYAALMKILPGNCHHMQSVLQDKTGRHTEHFLKAARGEVSEEEWREFIRSERLSAAVDYPMSLFWRELMDIYPNAKVLFTDRDPVKWYESVMNTVYQITKFMHGFINLPLKPFLKGLKIAEAIPYVTYTGEMGKKYPRGMFGVIEGGEEEAVRFFNDLKKEVIAQVPPERLLVWQVKEGWAPLCAFLGVPVPDEPFPNTNDTAMMKGRIATMKKVRALGWAVITGTVAAASYYVLG